MNVLIINNEMGNIGSLETVIRKLGHNPIVSSDSDQIFEVETAILPGVGSFKKGMENLKKFGWYEKIKERAKDKNFKLLGICLGMQLLAEKGHEGGEAEGLALIPGEVEKLTPTQEEERVPHLGWNEVKFEDNDLFEGIPSHSDFYFVHSFEFKCPNDEYILAKTPYCGEFISAIKKDNCYGVQFHPEKSSHLGQELIRNFIESF